MKKENIHNKKSSLIKHMADMLFEKIPYSKRTYEMKDKVSDSLQHEYEKESENMNEVQAAGSIMSKYGTIDDAAKLAGYSDDEIQEMESSSGAVTLSQFKKVFNKSRLFIYAAVICLIFAVVSAVNMFIENALFIILSFVLAVLGILLLRFVIRKRKIYADESILFGIDTYEYIKEQSDRYAKRFVNSTLFGIAGVFYYIFVLFMPLLSKDSKISDTFAQIFSNVMVIELVIFIIAKNIIYYLWISGCQPKSYHKKFYKQTGALFAVSVVYWAVIVTAILSFRDGLVYPFNFLIASEVVYAAVCLIYNLTVRSSVVVKNININKKRIAAAVLICFVLISYQVLQMDSFLMQPYISTISAADYIPDKITYNDADGVYTITTDKEDFKVLQLTDIHLGGSSMSYVKDHKALNACYDLIKYTKPDLVIVTGDLVFPMGIFSYSLNNRAPIIQFASSMRNIGIPWAFTYGNHDTEKMATATVSDIENLMLSLSDTTSMNKFLYPHTQPDIMGRSNQLIEVRNTDGSMKQALFLIDSNDYTGNGFNDYDYIHDDQVEWYSNQLAALNNEAGKTVPSMLFFHIPLQQYRTAYELYKKGSSEVKYCFGENNEKMINKVCCSNYPSKLFDAAKKLGTKAMFCGHDHYNNMSLEYQGIRLTYGMSIDYLAMPDIENETKQRGATLITIKKDADFDISQVPLTSVPQSKSALQSTLQKLQK